MDHSKPVLNSSGIPRKSHLFLIELFPKPKNICSVNLFGRLFMTCQNLGHFYEILQLFSCRIRKKRTFFKLTFFGIEKYENSSCIMSGVSANSSHFLKEKQDNQCAGNLWGAFDTRDGKKVVWISQEAFRRIAEQNGFSNFKTLLSDLEENGRICRFSDRYVTSHRLGAVKVKCYCLVVE